MFDSVLTTTTYVVGKSVAMPSLSCAAVYFVANRNTSKQAVADYTNWFTTLNLMTADERSGILAAFSAGGDSACTIRIPLDDGLCEALFRPGRGAAARAGNKLDDALAKSLLDPTAARSGDRVPLCVLDDANVGEAR